MTREGFVVIPQVGQVYVANLTLGQLEDQLYGRLGRVYSGVRRGADATTRFQLSIGRLRNIQVYVAGDVVRPGAYQISSAGTVLTALYAAGGPTTQRQLPSGSRSGAAGRWSTASTSTSTCSSGSNPPTSGFRTATWCSSRCTGRWPRWPARCMRPAIYELLPGETLRDAIAFAGGFDPSAVQARVTIHRILPPASRGPGGRARVVIAVGADQFSGGVAPAVPMAPGRLGDRPSGGRPAARLRHRAGQRLGRGPGRASRRA